MLIPNQCCSSILLCGMKFVILIHPKEAKKQKTGTGRLTHLSLLGSELICGIDFTDNIRVNSLIRDPHYFPLVAFPGYDALYCHDSQIQLESTGRTLLIFLIDATWSNALKMMKKSKNLLELPKLTFEKKYHSKFKIKRQPKDHCLSTIESAYYLIEEIKASGKIDTNINQQPLLNVFQKLVNYQIFCQNENKRDTTQNIM